MSNQTVIAVKKPVGKTPLQMIDLLREKNPSVAEERLGYAGRLDPMADGLLLILSGEANDKRKDFEKLPKTYTCRALFDIATDSYDILGLFTQPPSQNVFSEKDLKDALNKTIGKQKQEYPAYSSPRVKGHPLFWWAREGRLDEIKIPSKIIEVYSAEFRTLEKISLKELQDEILVKLSTVTGEFRQKEIISQWEDFFHTKQSQQFLVAEMEISCSSGTYIRSLIHQLGKRLTTGALALSITRTKIGDYTLEKALTIV